MRGVQVLEDAMNQNAPLVVQQFIQQFHPNHPVGWSDLNAILGYLQLSIMNVGYVPKMVFLDRKGTIVAQYEGGNPFFNDEEGKNIRAELDKMLKAPPPPAAHKKGPAGKASRAQR